MGFKEGNEFTDDIRVIFCSLLGFTVSFLAIMILMLVFGNVYFILPLAIVQLILCVVTTILFGRIGMFISVALNFLEVVLSVYEYAKTGSIIDLFIFCISLGALAISLIIQIFMGNVYSRMFKVKNLYDQARNKIFKLEEDQNVVKKEVEAKPIIVRHEQSAPRDTSSIATSDPLTTLPNRYKVINILDSWIDDRLSLMQSHGGVNDSNDYGITIIYLKLKNFGTLITKGGHHLTDLYIQSIAHRLRESIYPKDLLGRVSNGEFIILAMRTMDEKELKDYCDLLTAVMTKSFCFEKHKVDVTTAIGISSFPEDGRFANDLISSAEFAMGAGARRVGDNENSCETYNDTKQEFHQTVYTTHFSGEKLEKMEKLITKALERNEIHLVYQPQFDNKGKLKGFEAFLRWNNEELGEIKALDFLQAAERTGMIFQLGNYCIYNALETLRTINKTYPDLKMTINVSESELKNGSVPGYLADQISRHKVNPENIIIDIPEECLTSAFDEVRPTINYIASLGVSMTLDNFGRSYSSLNNIPLLPIIMIKLDSVFTRRITHDEATTVLTASIIDLMHEIDIDVCATGVGSEEIYNLLDHYGCDYYQGAFLSKPMMNSDIDAFIKKTQARD